MFHGYVKLPEGRFFGTFVAGLFGVDSFQKYIVQLGEWLETGNAKHAKPHRNSKVTGSDRQVCCCFYMNEERSPNSLTQGRILKQNSWIPALG